MAFSKLRPRLSLIALCVISGLYLAFLTTSSNGKSPKADTAADKFTVPEARRQTKLLHDTYIATLHTVHRSYFDKDEREIIPAGRWRKYSGRSMLRPAARHVGSRSTLRP